MQAGRSARYDNESGAELKKGRGWAKVRGRPPAHSRMEALLLLPPPPPCSAAFLPPSSSLRSLARFSRRMRMSRRTKPTTPAARKAATALRERARVRRCDSARWAYADEAEEEEEEGTGREAARERWVSGEEREDGREDQRKASR